MPEVIGADPAAVQALAAAMGHEASRLDAISHQTRAHLHGVHWHGSDVEAIKREWDGRHSRVLAAAAQSLRESRSRLVGEAQQQIDASGFGGHPGLLGALAALTSGRALRSVGGWRGLIKSMTPSQRWLGLLHPSVALPAGLLASVAGAMTALHIKELRIGDGDNHIIIAPDGTISFKLNAIKTEVTMNTHDGSFRAQIVGLGIQHTKDDAWGIMAAPGVNLGPLKLSVGMEATYNPHTGVIAPSGGYEIAVGHVIATDASIHEALNLRTGDFHKDVSMGGEVLGARHEATASEHNGSFESYTTKDTVHAGPVTITHSTVQSMSPDGTYTHGTSTTETVAAHGSLDTKYFAATTDDVGITHTDSHMVSTTQDGTQTINDRHDTTGIGTGQNGGTP